MRAMSFSTRASIRLRRKTASRLSFRWPGCSNSTTPAKSGSGAITSISPPSPSRSPKSAEHCRVRSRARFITMDLLQSLGMMAGYNRWMNEKLYAFCAQLPDEERKRDRKAFFGSIHGTLNHLLLTDRGWLWRFNGTPWTFRSLDQELYNDFEELRRERVKTDCEIEEFLAGITPERLDAPISYQNYAGNKFTNPLGPALVHLFNHQTHHRGQLTTLLSQLGIDPGVTDAMAFYREHVLR